MNEFLEELKRLLVANHSEDVDGIIEYFNEYIEDKKELGQSEEDILEELGSPIDIASEILDKKVSQNNVTGLITKIDANVTSYDIKIVTCDSSEVLVEREENDDVLVETKNNVLRIKQLHESHHNGLFNRMSEVIRVKLPNNSHLEEVTVISTSGDMEIEGSLSIDNVDIRNTSGDIELNNVEIGLLSFEVISGDIELNNSQIHKASMSTKSGDVSISETTMSTCDINVISGDIDLDDMEIHELNARSISGDIDIHLVGEGKDYTVQENLKKYGNGENVVNVSTVSGDIDIHFND